MHKLRLQTVEEIVRKRTLLSCVTRYNIGNRTNRINGYGNRKHTENHDNNPHDGNNNSVL